MERIVNVVLYLAERNMAFCGSDDIIGSKHKGNFLGTIEILSKYDAVLSELLGRIRREETGQHYLSNTIQNEEEDSFHVSQKTVSHKA
jgi:hypothetical protein